MDRSEPYGVRPIGVVRSSLSAPAEAPNQAFEGAPEAVLEIAPPSPARCIGSAPAFVDVKVTMREAPEA